LLDSKALTKIQSIILIAVVVVAAVGGGVAYVLLRPEDQTSETIKIGILADLGNPSGDSALQGAILAAEQLNAQGGILGKEVEVIGEDHDILSGVGPDMLKVSSALTLLITRYNVDFIIGQAPGDAGFVCQDIVAEHKKIFFGFGGVSDEWAKRVMNDYDKYKYYFNLVMNQTMGNKGIPDSLIELRENTGFNKVALLGESLYLKESVIEGFKYVLTEVYGFEVVYAKSFPLETFDFSSYFAAAEAAGAEIVVPFIGSDSGIPFIKEYYDRQSPLVIYSGVLSVTAAPECWEWTDGKCDHITTSAKPIEVGYPYTNKTLPTRDAYRERWNENVSSSAATVYDTICFVLLDAIERAGTLETEAVIDALESISIETSSARKFAFTSSHDLMFGENWMNGDYQSIIVFQWQNGEMIPVYPKKIMEEAGASYTYPPWSGPWDNIS
jgi:branched-chain amino acid transport system substrate-binding protein